MNVREIVIAHLKAIGADGLCAHECGCGLDDFMPCDELACLEECKPAKRYLCDRSCGIGCHGPDNGDCYRPMNATTNEEETHL